MRFGIVLGLALLTAAPGYGEDITVEAMRKASPGADMTAAIQKVLDTIDRAAASGTTVDGRGTGVVTFGPGEYLVGTLRVGRNISHVVGHGAIMKTKPYAGEGNRIFILTWDSDRDSHLVTIEGFHFDLNRNQQGWQGGHDLSHQAAIFLSGRNHNNRKGRLNVLVKNCYWHDSVADGLYVHHQVSLKMQDCIARDCFRGGLVITGDKAEVDVNNYTSTSTELRTGIDVEPNSSMHNVHLRLNNVRLIGSVLDIGLPSESSMVANNVQSSGPVLLYKAGVCKIRN